MPKPIVIPLPLTSFHENMLDGLEFCRLTYTYFDEVCAQPNGGHVLRERKGPVKQLVEELLPICRYIHKFYRPGQYISVRWVYGNQSFDAKMEAKGFMVENEMWPARGTLEITQAVHRNEHLMRELLNSKGGGFSLNGLEAGKGKPGSREITSECLSYDNHSYIDEMCVIILSAINAKIVKLESGDYPGDTTLIVGCSLTNVFYPSEWTKLVAMVKKSLPSNRFVRIFLVSDVGNYFAEL